LSHAEQSFLHYADNKSQTSPSIPQPLLNCELTPHAFRNTCTHAWTQHKAIPTDSATCAQALEAAGMLTYLCSLCRNQSGESNNELQVGGRGHVVVTASLQKKQVPSNQIEQCRSDIVEVAWSGALSPSKIQLERTKVVQNLGPCKGRLVAQQNEGTL